MDKHLNLKTPSAAPSTSNPRNDSSDAGQHLQEDPDVAKNLVEENRILKAALEKKSQEFNQTMKIVREVLGKDGWIKMKAKWAAQTQELAELKAEGEQFQRDVEDLKGSLCKVGRELREKEKTVRRLGATVARLEVRSGQPRNSKEGLKGDRQILMDAVSLLPEEIWAVIFGKLPDPADLSSCCNACLLFERMLHPWKTSWALEEALPHLDRHRLPKSRDLIEIEERPLCENWDAVLNQILENHPSLRPHQDGSDPRRLDFIYPAKEAGIDWNLYRFSEHPADNHPELEVEAPGAPKKKGHVGRIPFVGRWLNLIRDRLTPGNAASDLPMPVGMTDAGGKAPFLGRYLNLVLSKVNVPYTEGQEEATEKTTAGKWWRQLYNFFDRFGKEIWYLTLVIMLDSKQDPWVKKKLKHFLTSKLFKSAPNLRKLEIRRNWDYGCDLLIKRKSFEPAPNLETLEFHNISSGYRLSGSLVKRFHGQLRKLNMCARHMRCFSTLDWPNLVELHLVDLGLRVERANDNDLWVFRWLLGVKMPQLRKLGLVFSTLDKVPVENLMELINGLSSSTRLTTLRLVGPLHGFFCFKELDKIPCAPRTLKTLEIANPWNGESSSQFSFDILLRCFPFLENLIVFFLGTGCHYYEMEVSLMVQADLNKMAAELECVEEFFVEMNRFMYDGRMYESNIWELLPLLKVFTFQLDVYSREGYELTRLF